VHKVSLRCIVKGLIFVALFHRDKNTNCTRSLPIRGPGAVPTGRNNAEEIAH
jgi:hypothetical protein